MNAAPTPAGKTRILVVSALAFLVLGGLVALYGPLFPTLRARFGLGVDEVGAVVSAHFVGSLLAVVASGFVIRRAGYKRSLILGASLLSLGLAALFFAPTWASFLAAATVAGAGFGLVQVAVNLMVARAFFGAAAPALNLINAVFGAGATVTPLVVAATAPSISVPVLGLAGVALLVLAAVPTLVGVPTPGQPAAGGARGAMAPVVAFVLLYFGYVSTEVGVTSWATEHLTPTLGAARSAAVPGIYWGTLTVGRLLAAALTTRVRPGKVLLGGLAVATGALVAAAYAPLAPVMYALVGLALAPTFATGLAWLTERMPDRAEQVSPAVFVAASVGPIATAPLIGVGISAFGPTAVPVALAGLCLLALGSAAWLRRGDLPGRAP